MKHIDYARKKVFISHTQKDFEQCKLGPLFCDVLVTNNYEVFCSSNPNTQIETGKELHEEMNRQLKECDIFLAIVTENYLRSPHCVYEMSVARFLMKNQPIIIYANDNTQKNISDIANPEWICINLSNEDGVNVGYQRLINTFNIKKEQQPKIYTFLQLITTIPVSNRPYIGMSKEKYKNLLEYCEKEGITKFSNGNIYTKDEMISHFGQAKIIYIVSTTGAGLLKTLKEEALVKALGNKSIINIIIPDRDSTFCHDVAEAECNRDGYNSVIAEQNRYRIEAEFVASIQFLNEAICLAKKKYGNDIGAIYCYSSHTLLRQTIVLVISDKQTSWGWINMTMPPLRTTDTPSIAICDNSVKNGLDKLIINHCECLMNIAEKKNAVRKICGNSSAEKLCTTNIETYWKEKKKKAEIHMASYRKKYKKILIEVAAQHPLIDGHLPNNEFKHRLDVAFKISQQIGTDQVWIYIPGSRHKHEGQADTISLSLAGKIYLKNLGVDETHIFADEANYKYKGDLGVYNSADECYVTSQMFCDNNFGRLICICSPNQIMRKTFYYIEFGLLPECYGIPNAEMYHDVITEYFGSLHHTVYEDHNWQNIDSINGIKSRIERKP